MNHEETIFEQALGIESPTDREAWLREACAGDESLFQSLQGLLRVHDRAGKFLDPDAQESLKQSIESAVGAMPPLIAEKPGDRIGRYKLLERIGEGGCGVVYMAEQEEPVRRQVALKVIKLGMDTEAVIARFEAERQALALMDHPNIAKVFDAGATDVGARLSSTTAAPPVGGCSDDPSHAQAQAHSAAEDSRDPCLLAGRPYFVMELVRGAKITEFCDHNKLTTAQRLELFMQVCRAVQHAHQKGIIHRDIKPSNILVALHDDLPVPKVIDFGIAKATQGRLTDVTVFTAFQQFMGTPAYMSPEQAEMSGLDVDTRSDIYSLGVLLYELLTGQTPFDAETLLVAGLDEMRRIIRTKDPVPPSTRFRKLDAAEQTTVARRRQVESPRLINLVRGDLDWIVMKCLEKDRRRRYDKASSVAEDLKRYLEDQPVSAAAPSFYYRTKKLFVRRRTNLGQVGIGALLALMVGLATLPLFKSQRGKVAADSGPGNALAVTVISHVGAAVEGVSCKLVVGGYPAHDKRFPISPDAENVLSGFTDKTGKVVFRHQRLQTAGGHALYITATDYSGATRFLNSAESKKGAVTIVLSRPLRVKLRYAFNPGGDWSLASSNLFAGNVTLYPMEDGAYRPPARAFFSFKQDKIVGSSAVLDVGIAIDQKGETLYFGDSRSRFDHCTDIGPVPLGSVETVDTNKLVRERTDTPLVQGHSYIFESNVYPPEKRTQYTGYDVTYAKLFVDSIEEITK